MKHQIIVCLAQPRSGSTFLMRLLNQRCSIGVRGDMPIEYLKGLMDTWKGCQSEGQYGSLAVHERERSFADEYRGPSLNHESFLDYTGYFIRNLLLGGSAGFMKTTQVGFGNDLTVEFVQFLREVCDRGQHELKLIFLERDHDQIVLSLEKKWAEKGMYFDFDRKDYIKSYLQSQQEQFQEASQLGDIRISYDKMIADPFALIKRLKLDSVRYLEDNIEGCNTVLNTYLK